MTDKELQEKYLGKRIQIPYSYLNNIGSSRPTVEGICKFIGHNPNFPSWGIQVTIERMPVTNVDISTIKIIENDNTGKSSMVYRPAP